MIEIDTYTGSANRPTIRKDADATLDYQFDWSAYLTDPADAIASGSFIVEGGLTIHSQVFGQSAAVVWLSGGSVGLTYRVTCRITTNGGRTDERSIFLKIVER